MANQPETPVWRAGVFQLETTTPVRGGAGGESNTPLLNLADRTAYLKSRVDAIEAALPLLAPLTSPDFSGTPQAVTPPDGDATRKLVTTEWVQALYRGVTSRTITGGTVALTSVEAGRGILIFTGTLTADATVTLPASIPGRWVVANRTTGAFALTARVVGGAGVTIGQGRVQSVFSDGTNLAAALSEAADLALLGTPTAPTASPATNNTQVASTAFARRLARGAAAITATGGATISLSDTESVSPVVLLGGSPASAFSVVFPTEAGRWTVRNATGQAATLRASGQAGGLSLSPGATRSVFTDGTNLREAASESSDHALRGAPTATTPAQAAAGLEVVTAEWVRTFLAGQALYNTGDLKVTLKASPDPGWLFLDGRTIGSASSGATARANADTQSLFELIWNNLADAQAPVFGGRGASAAADWTANKRITLPDVRGRALVGAGQGSGLTSRALGALFGAETHILALTEIPAHDHGSSTGAAGAHGHSAWTGEAGSHTHGAWTGEAGHHSHSAAADTQGEHTHSLPGLYIGGFGFGHTGSNGFSGNLAYSTGAAGAHSHNISIGAGGSHTHGVGIGDAGAHTHGVGIAEAPAHTHTIPIAGGNQAHPNVQPSIAFNVMVKL